MAMESMPRSFPSLRHHGSLSEFEPPIIMSQHAPHRHVTVEGGTAFIRSDEDLPSLNKPCPVSYEKLAADPILCLTPEKKIDKRKSPIASKKSSLGSRGTGSLSSSKRGSQSVRFDSNVDIKFMSPRISPHTKDSLQHEDRLWQDEDDVLIDDVVGPVCLDSTLEEDPIPSICKYSSDINSKQLSSEDSTSPMNGYHELKSNLPLKSSKHEPHGAVGNHKALLQYPDSYTGLPSLLEAENALARPEFLSTLRVTAEMKQLEQQQLDVAAAVSTKLHQSTKTREKITEKVSAKVNVGLNKQFGELVSLDVRPQEFAERKAKEISSRVRPTHKTNRTEDRLGQPPDVMEFFSREFEREVPSMTLRGLPNLEVPPVKAELHRAFDVYQHIQAWELR